MGCHWPLAPFLNVFNSQKMSCSVILDNYQTRYEAGSTIQGRFICTFNKAIHIRGIQIKLIGEEHNEWTETESYYDSHEKKHKTRRIEYTGDETFLNIQNKLQGDGYTQPGRFEYPFSFSLPKDLPSSYHGPYGGVFFTIKGKVDVPYKFDYTDNKTIRVFSPIDFNVIRNRLQLEEVSYSDDKTLCCWCCASDPITMEVTLEKEAFVPGETVKVKVDIMNMSNTNITGIDVKMKTNVESRVTHPSHKSRDDEELMARTGDTGVGAHGQRTYNLEVDIPENTVVPNFSLCSLFKHSTTLSVTANIDGCHSDMDIEMYIIMGHIPVSDQGDPSPPPYPPNAPNQDPPPYPPFASPGFPQSPASVGNIGFTVPQDNNSPYPKSSQAPSAPGPSAPPAEDSASAPSKQQEEEGGFVEVDATAPPSYNEAMSKSSKQ